jgi:hypothetical protein
LAYVGDRPVIDSLGAELEAIVGTEVYVELRQRIAPEHGSNTKWKPGNEAT